MAEEQADEAVALATEAVRLIGDNVRYLGAALHALKQRTPPSGATTSGAILRRTR